MTDMDSLGRPLGLDHPLGRECCETCGTMTDGNTHTRYELECCGELMDHPDNPCPYGCATSDTKGSEQDG